MQFRELAVPHAFAIEPVQHRDDRGVFLETFRADLFEAATGRRFGLAQGNLSVSRAGVVRGIHFADVPTGQAKYVTCVAGRVVDHLVDLRVGSPTFGSSVAVELDDETRRAVFVPEGVGHLFVATSERATVNYLTTDVYRPEREHTVHPLDPQLALPLPTDALLAPRDADAPTLSAALDLGILPTWEACLAHYASLTPGTA